MPKRNCWEHMKCGREPGRAGISEAEKCPATTEKLFDGVHGGVNGGRVCWIIRRTKCDGHIDGDFFKKIKDCTECGFYKVVEKEEEDMFALSLPFIKDIWKVS